MTPETSELFEIEDVARRVGKAIQESVEAHPRLSVAGILAAVPSLLNQNAKMHISSTVYINRMDPSLGPTEEHIDRDDCHGCFVVPFGDYEGGEISFPHLAQTVRLSAGDCMWFDSSQLVHHNFAVSTGTRFSMVFATHTQVMRITSELPPLKKQCT